MINRSSMWMQSCLTGARTSQKQDMIKALFDAIDALVPSQVSISVEAIDMDRANYIKR